MSQQLVPTKFDLPSDVGGKDLGIFMPIANGGWILSKNKPELDGSYAYNRQVAVLAEKHGYDFIMSMAKYRGYGGETEHWNSTLDATVTMAALAEVTERVKVWTTVHTILQNPGTVAKMIATLDQVTKGRAGLNVVTGAYKGEFSQMGMWPEGVDHDARYDLAKDWIQAIKALWTQPSVTMQGDYFQLEDCVSNPKPSTKPFLVCAGSSEVGMRFSANEMDAIFLSGDVPEKLAQSSNKVKGIAADMGRYIRTYAMQTIVLGETDAEAEATALHYREGLDEEALRGMMRAYGFLDAEIGEENAFVKKARSSFMAPHVAGSPDTVIQKIGELLEVSGIDGLMLIFPDYISAMPLFAEHVMPKLRAKFPALAGAA